MNTVYRNLLSIVRRFKMAMLLNVLGLAVAFAAFIIIMKQIDYDRTFDRSDPNHDRIYRMELVHDGTAQAIICRPLAELFFASSPHIEAGTIANPFFRSSLFFRVDTGSRQRAFRGHAVQVSPSFTDVFTFDFVEGSKAVLGEPGQVMLPLSMARKLFGDAPAVGKVLRLADDNTLTVGAVYRDLPTNTIVDNAIYYAMSPSENRHDWGNWNYYIYFRTDGSVAPDELFDNFKRNLVPENTNGIDFSSDESVSLRFTPLPDIHFTTDASYDITPKASLQTLLVLLAIGIAIVVIAGINFTNFSTALTPMRIRSINTQRVLGSSPSMIRRSLLAEAMIISLAAWVLSLLMLDLFAITPLAQLVDADLSLAAHPLIVGGTALFALVVGLLAGLYPAFYMTSFPPMLALKGSFGLSPAGRMLRSVLIGIQFVASFVLIIGASFIYLQNWYMQHTPLGYDKDALIVTNLSQTVVMQLDAFTNQLKADAAVADVTYGKSLLSSSDKYMGWGRVYRDKNINYQCLPVDWSFLRVVGITPVEGRDFRIEDTHTRHGAYIFNEKARDLYGLEIGTAIDSATIIGFIPDIKFASFRNEVEPMAFYVWGTEKWGIDAQFAYIKVKGGADIRSAMEHVRRTLTSFESDYPFNVRLYDEVLQRLYEKESSLGMLITLFSLVAVFISIVGVFGLVVFDSEYRKKEIGIRKVFGSTTAQVLLRFNRNYLRILAVCFVLAVPLAWLGISRWLQHFAYRTPLYWWVFALSLVAVAVVTFAVVTFQHWRAANANPIDSIRTE